MLIFAEYLVQLLIVIGIIFTLRSALEYGYRRQWGLAALSSFCAGVLVALLWSRAG